MPTFSPPSVSLPGPAVLLVLLPPVPYGEVAAEALNNVAMRTLQQRLGPAIRVLKIDEATHPAVVRSFGTPQLPACVLVRQGVELWRQQGLPEDDAMVATLLETARV
jgi:hypothetical protein